MTETASLTPTETARPDFSIDYDTLVKQIRNRTGMFWENREFNAGIGRRSAFWLAVLGTVGTISIGVSGMITEYKSAVTFLALVCTAAATGLQSWVGFFGHRQAHLFYSDGHTRLWALRRDLEHIEKMPEGEAKTKALRWLYESMQTMLVQSHEEWKKQQVEAVKGNTK